jgi:aspartyl/asparaginyl-tRNA synthetase
MNTLVNSNDFTEIVKKLRDFFFQRNFLEVHTQNRLSILAACEDPTTIATYEFQGIKWPLPQTGQMWLEYELLKNPSYEGVFCLSTSYRQEPNPIPGRHNVIFPMFEFESRGDLDNLMDLLTDLSIDLGFAYSNEEILRIDYENAAKDFGVKELSHQEENQMNNKYNKPVIFLKNFPEYTSPFWNMKRHTHNNLSKKVDVIIGGMETMGCAERENDIEVMRKSFYSISNGEYANLLYKYFGKKRVIKELEEFLALPMFQRYGGGIGVTRLIKNYKQLKTKKYHVWQQNDTSFTQNVSL